MQETGTGQVGSAPPRKGFGGLWLVVGAAMLCPISKLVILASMGGALGGLLGNKWFLAGAFAIVAVAAWLGFRLVRKRLARRGQATLLRCDGPAAEVAAQGEQGRERDREKDKEYTS